MSRFTRRGRAAAKRRPLLAIGDISYLAGLGRISRAEAEREAERFLRETWPVEMLNRRAKALPQIMADLRRYPTTEWVQMFLELLHRLAAQSPPTIVSVDALLRGELPKHIVAELRGRSVRISLDRPVQPDEEEQVGRGIAEAIGLDPETTTHHHETTFAGGEGWWRGPGGDA